ncbi:hypothetical protein AB1M95_17340 [Sulfitobacter sp. LCG007]
MLDEPIHSVLSPIYRAAVDCALWPEALDAIVHSIGAAGAALLIRPPGPAGRDRPHLDSRLERFGHSPSGYYYALRLEQRQRPGWDDLRASPLHAVLRDADFADAPGGLDGRADYRFLRKRLGFGRRIGMRLSADAAWLEALAVFLPAGSDALPESARATLAATLPHLTKALDQARLFSQLAARHGKVLGALEHVRVGMAVVLRSGEIISSNAEARHMLELRDGIGFLPERNFRCASSALTARLHAAVAQASITAAGRGNVPEYRVRLERPSGAAAFLVDVSPLNDARDELCGPKEAALLTLIDPGRLDWVDLDGFAALCGLDDETRDACETLIRGPVPVDIRDARRPRGDDTSAAHKLGVRTREDLLRLMLSVMPPVD